MSLRLIRADLDSLVSDSDVCLPVLPVLPVEQPASGRSFLSSIRQRLAGDEELAEQLQCGNTDALTVIFNRYSALLFGIARRVLKNDAEAEDAVQQVFLDVFRSIQQFDREKGSFRNWLMMFTYQRTFNRRRAQISNGFFDTEAIDDSIADRGSLSSWRPGYSTGENSILIDQVLETLEPRQKRTIELIYREGLTAHEVSVRTGESVRIVRHNLYRGLEKLRIALSGQEMNTPKSKGRSR
jgi:RNA polymerase sigma-70 factor, ECF subfamily